MSRLVCMRRAASSALMKACRQWRKGCSEGRKQGCIADMPAAGDVSPWSVRRRRRLVGM